MMRVVFTISIVSIILLIACQKDDSSSIDDLLIPYFEDFKTEASERGIIVDFEAEGISASIVQIEGSGIAGQCQRLMDDQNQIYIDANFWKTMSEDDRTFVIFHELGHCFLKRDHLDTADGSGTCLSIMNSGALSGCDLDFNTETKEDYYDELFQ